MTKHRAHHLQELRDIVHAPVDHHPAVPHRAVLGDLLRCVHALPVAAANRGTGSGGYTPIDNTLFPQQERNF